MAKTGHTRGRTQNDRLNSKISNMPKNIGMYQVIPALWIIHEELGGDIANAIGAGRRHEPQQHLLHTCQCPVPG